MKKSLLVLCLFITVIGAFAQRGGFDRTEMVDREKDMVLTKVSDLSPDQKMLLEGIYEEYGVTMNETIDEIRKSGDFSQFREKMPALQNEKNLLIKDVLDAGQYASYEKIINGGGLGFGGGRRQNEDDSQPAQEVQPVQSRSSGFDVSAMVIREKDKVMTEVPDLSEDQKSSLQEIYNEFEASLKETSDEVSRSGDFSQIREKMPALRNQKDMKIKEVLSVEQFATYQEVTKRNSQGPGRGRQQGENVGTDTSGVEQ